MRTTSAALTLVLVAFACDGGTPAAPTGLDRTPGLNAAGRAEMPGQAAPLRIENERYFSDNESFSFCDGRTVLGEMIWHEVIVAVQTPDGTVREHGTYNMASPGRAYDADGTEYIVHQVNVDRTVEDPDLAQADFRYSIRIMVISRGGEENALYTDVRWNGEHWETCRS